MNLELSKKQFRRLLDLAYIGNWILNSTRGNDRCLPWNSEIRLRLPLKR